MTLLIQILFMILLTLIAVFFRHIIGQIVHTLVHWHHLLVNQLATIFSHGTWGRILQTTLGLIIIPIIIGLIVGFITWLIKRRLMPYVMFAAWTVWIILVVSVVG